MSRYIRQSGVLELSEEEFGILLAIFEQFPEYIMLTSTYMAIDFQGLNVLITDGMIAELIKMMNTPSLEEEHKELINRILEFRSNAILTIE